ncbi:hypothetical protein [Micromonospora sp. 4G55]|uniref:hypothetical protein n=1 Tax=Micromonospora sp. 4G55 TaxID=2806102 RepID=UPI001EE43927|nr:hypothetical protein [Micromonospora sp. 4G55]
MLISPMPGAGAPGGALILVRRAERPGFDQRDVELVREFAARAGASHAAAQLYGEQAHLARVLQHSLLPPELPSLPGLALAGGYRAAGTACASAATSTTCSAPSGAGCSPSATSAAGASGPPCSPAGCASRCRRSAWSSSVRWS